MISVKEAAKYYGLTATRLKQIIKEDNLEIVREKNNYIKIPNATMAAINEKRGRKIEKKRITIGIEKGGSGKSSLTIFTAITLARYGYKVAVCDFDPEFCASLFLAKDEDQIRNGKTILDVFEEGKQIVDFLEKSRFDGVDFLPSRAKVRKLEKTLWGKNPKTLINKKLIGMDDIYDVIFFDLPPSFTTLCASAYLSSSLILCPVNSDIFSLESLFLTIEDIEESAEQFEAKVPEIKVIKNKFSSETRKSAKAVATELNRECSDFLLEVQIKNTSKIENCLNEGKSIWDDRGGDDVKASFLDLAKVVVGLDI